MARRDTDTDVVLGGALFCDLVLTGTTLPGPGEEVYADSFTVSPGGVATRAVACARLGLRTTLVGVHGDDMFGDRVAADLAAEPGLDLHLVRRVPGLHTAVTVAVADEQDRRFLTYEQPGGAVPSVLPEPAPTAEVCNIGLGRGDVPAWVSDLRAAGTRVYGGVGWDPTQRWSPDVFTRLAGTDVLCVSDVEAAGYTGQADPDEAARILARHVPLAVVTRGAAGVIGHDGRTGEHVSLPAVPVRAVDPTGAGDVLLAALMLGGVRGWGLTRTLRLGTLAAAVSVTRPGGATGAPRPEELIAFLDAEQPAGDWAEVRTWAGRAAAAA